MSEKEIKILEAIRTRRSIRIYHPDRPLSPEQVQVIMEAALRAPSSKNKHTTQFILVENKETLKALSFAREKGLAFLRDVPLAVVVLGSPMECQMWEADASLAIGYMQLQAWELGIGSCWGDIYGKVTANGQDSVEYVRNILDIPYQLEVLCVVALGYVNGEAPERPVESLRWEQIHIGKYHLPEQASKAEQAK
ncbi:MAG: nitroreductase family protein [Porphyromonadaceae bacterium]|nr:nitroreductase family protein [Porphyromonadaceae bacterium]